MERAKDITKEIYYVLYSDLLAVKFYDPSLFD